ncbi:MAG: 5-(carboxyamino)imidazole ribonucleotide synthase [Candidatus Melainabacteria bacterium]|nr:5-(carboxyamino)imidazole ribonucleotide synthase [Candidatus Melainabacteria bacterium]
MQSHTTVGILGGGQLGLLLARSIINLGGKVLFYEPDSAAPACLHFRSINEQYNDVKAMTEFINSVDVITYEFENVDATTLRSLKPKTPVYPSLDVLNVTQDRIAEKTFLQKNKLPHAKFQSFRNLDELKNQHQSLVYPCILKTARGGYDGHGQFFVEDKHTLESLLKALEQKYSKDTSFIAEEVVDIAIELSCITAVTAEGDSVAFPVMENRHREHILDTTLVPARISPEIEARIRKIALDAASMLKVTGLLTTEFFLSNDDEIFINEFAPRPHNSGHVTMKSCSMSQFDALARVLLNQPLSEIAPASADSYCMMNLLGDVWLAQNKNNERAPLNLTPLPEHESVMEVVLYGKELARARRKMGHFITRSQKPAKALELALDFREALKKVQN